jgi:hypothetical protein
MSMDGVDLTIPFRAGADLDRKLGAHLLRQYRAGVFARGSRYEEYAKTHNLFQIKVLWRAILEWKQVLACSEVVKIGKGTVIHPEATVLGPTTSARTATSAPAWSSTTATSAKRQHRSGLPDHDQRDRQQLLLPVRASAYFCVFMTARSWPRTRACRCA